MIVCCRPSNHAINAPEGAGGESVAILSSPGKEIAADGDGLSSRANNHVHRAPKGAGSESPNDANIVVGSNVDVVGLPEVHANDRLCAITGSNDSNDYFNSDQQGSMDHLITVVLVGVRVATRAATRDIADEMTTPFRAWSASIFLCALQV